jgi:hypothetical protein
VEKPGELRNEGEEVEQRKQLKSKLSRSIARIERLGFSYLLYTTLESFGYLRTLAAQYYVILGSKLLLGILLLLVCTYLPVALQ